jgi:predicted HTH transcriptional regulator
LVDGERRIDLAHEYGYADGSAITQNLRTKRRADCGGRSLEDSAENGSRQTPKLMTDAELEDLNRRLFEEDYLPSAFAPDILERNERTYEERLSACRMIESVEHPTPTVVGCLVIGKRPRDLVACAYLQFLRIDGENLTDAIKDAEDIDGPIGEVIGRLDQKLEAHVQTAIDPASGPVEIRKPDYPLVALQQFSRNAIMEDTFVHVAIKKGP